MSHVHTEDGFKFWLKHAAPGQSVVYYTGFLMLDKEKLLQRGVMPENFPVEIKIAKTVWNYHIYGDVALTQYKKGPFVYEYLATKI